MLERWIRLGFPPTLLLLLPLSVWVRGSETCGGGAGAAVLAGALAVCVGGSLTPSMAMRMVESSCSGMLPSSEEKGLGGFSRHISQLVLPVTTPRDGDTINATSLTSVRQSEVDVSDPVCSTGAPQGAVLVPLLFTLSAFSYNSGSGHINGVWENQGGRGE